MEAVNVTTQGATMPLVSVRWRLKEFLVEHNLSTYALAKEVSGHLSQKSVYNLAGEPSSVNFETLNALLPALEKLTGEPVDISDLLEYQRDE